MFPAATPSATLNPNAIALPAPTNGSSHTIGAAVAVALTGLDGIGALAIAALIAGLVSWWSRRALGGRTGDTLGAVVALLGTVAAVAIYLPARRVIHVDPATVLRTE